MIVVRSEYRGINQSPVGEQTKEFQLCRRCSVAARWILFVPAARADGPRFRAPAPRRSPRQAFSGSADRRYAANQAWSSSSRVRRIAPAVPSPSSPPSSSARQAVPVTPHRMLARPYLASQCVQGTSAVSLPNSSGKYARTVVVRTLPRDAKATASLVIASPSGISSTRTTSY